MEFVNEKDEWVSIDPENETWEYQDGEDSESYVSGNFYVEINSKSELVVVDYDGCYELPEAVKKALEQEGYDLSEL